MDVKIDEPDWQILAGMGSGAKGGLEAAGIHDFDEAVEACAALQSVGASGAKYELDDLICLLCLSQHKEAVSNPGVPASARPVSIEQDLGLDPRPPRGLQAPPPLVCDDPSEEAQAVFPPALEDSAVQPLKARRWRANILLQPLAQPTSRPFASFALPLASVQNDMLPLLPIASAIFLVQCCRSLHAGGLFIAGRLADGKKRVADSVADILFRGEPYVALLKAGVSSSTCLRTVACAWDWLEKCPSVFIDERLLPLALLRLGIKYEGHRDHVDAALELLGSLDEKPALLSFECRLVEALWGLRDLLDGVECPSQPMAR